jgi:hypothetical protein
MLDLLLVPTLTHERRLDLVHQHRQLTTTCAVVWTVLEKKNTWEFLPSVLSTHTPQCSRQIRESIIVMMDFSIIQPHLLKSAAAIVGVLIAVFANKLYHARKRMMGLVRTQKRVFFL